MFFLILAIMDLNHIQNTNFKNLIEICFVMALMGKFVSFYNVEQYVKLKPNLFIKLGLVEKGKYPSNDTYARAFQYLDNTVFV